jgi:hypothetical protein
LGRRIIENLQAELAATQDKAMKKVKGMLIQVTTSFKG